MSTLRVDTIANTAGTTNNRVLQVVSTTKTDTFSSSSTSFVDVTGLSVNITPSSSSSKILIMADVSVGAQSFNVFIKLKRDSTDIYIPDAAGSRPLVSGKNGGAPQSGDVYGLTKVPVMYLDSPSTTSQITYKFQLRSYSTSYTAYINRTHQDRDNANYDPRTPSSITLMEIAG